MITLADRPTIRVDYTNDAKRLSDSVGSLFSMPNSGMTLLDAVLETAEGSRSGKPARRDRPGDHRRH